MPPSADLGIDGLVDPVEVGRGGSGVVYRARQPGLNRVVTVKVLSTVLDQTGLERFDREAYAMGTVAGHPNIVQILTTGTTPNGRPYLVMPYVEGGSLSSRLPVPWQHAVAYGIRLSGALETAHRAGVLHRDVKPSNVLISAFGEPLLADFGIARVSGGYETSEGLISASIPYAAPEILEGRPATPSSDVYALAATVFCAISGAPPFRPTPDEALVALYLRISKDPVPDLRPMGVPDQLCRVLEDAMAKDLTHRPPTAVAFGRALQDLQRTLGEQPTPMAVTEEVDRTMHSAPPLGWITGQPPGPGGWTPSPHPAATAVGAPVVPGGVAPGPPVRARGPKPHRARPGLRGWIVLGLVAVLVVAAGVVGTIALWPEHPPPAVPGTPTTKLLLKEPADLEIGGDGSLYIADDEGNKVVRVTAAGTVEKVAGTGESGDSGDGRPAAGAQLDSPRALAVATDGSVYVAVSGRIRRVDPAGLIRPVPGFEQYVSAKALAVADDGRLYAATDSGILVRTREGQVSTLVADLPGVNDLLLESPTQLLVSMSSGNTQQVIRIDTGTGQRTVVAGVDTETTPQAPDGDGYEPTATKLSSPAGLAVDSQGRLWFSESGANRVRRVQEDGTLLTIAGDPDDYSSGNEGDGGDAIDATFDLGTGAIVVDAHGTLYIADQRNGRIRTVDPAGIVEAYG